MYGEPWWYDIERRKLIRPPELSDNSTNSHLVAKQEEHGKGNVEFYLQIIFNTRRVLLTANGFTSPPKKSCTDFYYP
jgi:hypothetical protein